jgi:hypothetical protein
VPLNTKEASNNNPTNFFIMACIDILNIILSPKNKAQKAAILLTI